MIAKLSTSDPDDWFFFWRDSSGRLFKKRYDINRIKSKRKRRVEADRILKDINNLLKAGANQSRSVKTILDKIVSDRKGSLRRRSWQSYKYAADKFVQWLPDPNVPIHEITKQTARSFIDHLVKEGYTGKTINGLRGFLCTLFTYHCSREDGAVNPFIGTQRQAELTGRNIAFSEEQKSRIWSVLSPELLLFTRFIYFTYIRPIELLRLKVGDIKTSEGVIIIQPHQSKNKKQQSVEIPDSFLNEIKKMGYDKMPQDYYLFGQGMRPGSVPLSRNTVSKHYAKAVKGLGLPADTTLYSWKHTGVVAAYKSGIGIYDIMRQLRHHSLDMTQIYLKSLGLERNVGFARMMV